MSNFKKSVHFKKLVFHFLSLTWLSFHTAQRQSSKHKISTKPHEGKSRGTIFHNFRLLSYPARNKREREPRKPPTSHRACCWWLDRLSQRDSNAGSSSSKPATAVKQHRRVNRIDRGIALKEVLWLVRSRARRTPLFHLHESYIAYGIDAEESFRFRLSSRVVVFCPGIPPRSLCQNDFVAIPPRNHHSVKRYPITAKLS